jgi:hypothetical protein
MHPTKIVEYGDCKAEIDELLAPLILTLWKNDIETWFCCQEDDYWDDLWAEYRKMAHIQFDGIEEASKFMNLAVEKFKKFNDKFDPEEINPYPFFNWRYELYPQWDEKMKTWFMVTINFPTSDISIISKVLNDEELSEKELKEVIKDCTY